MNVCFKTGLLTSSQAAHRLGISRRRLSDLRRDPDGPEWGRFEGAIRYDIVELDAWTSKQNPDDGSTPPLGGLTPSDG